MITLRALGNAEIETSVTTITPSQEIVFAAALYLILERGHRVSRTRLTSLLWPRAADKVGAHRLRQTILQLKKLGIVVRADRNNLQLLHHDACSDLDSLLRTSESLTYDTSPAEFLAGYAPRCSEAFRDWVDTKREEIHSALTGILVSDLERARLRGDWIGVDSIASRCLVLDSFNETAVLAQAEATAMRGGKRRAVEILDRYIEDVGATHAELRIPASLLRRRMVERFPDKPLRQNGNPPFVGREPEMQTLISKVESTKAGNGSAILVTGEPGIGKSRLCEELARFALLQGAQLQRAACRRTDLDRPLSLFVDIVPQLREMPGALGCSPEAFASLKRLTDFELRSRDSLLSADSQMLFGDLRKALFDLFDSVASERWLLVVIEDIQWLDDVSSNILAKMIEWAPTKRILFLLNSRTADNSVSRATDGNYLSVVSLGALAPVPSSAVLRSIAARPNDNPGPGFFEWCIRVAEGNPFFLQELGHHWVETGHEYEAPPSVTKVLEERIARLSNEALQVLQGCAVLGEHATLERVEAVLELRPHQILSAVEELSKAAMLGVYQEGFGQTGQLQARHDLLSLAAVQRLADISVAFIHRRAADVLEKEIRRETVPTTLLWACANHRHSAGDRERAITLGIQCAEHLLELGLAREACDAFQTALDYCISDDQRLKVFPRLAIGFELAGEWEHNKEALRKSIQLFAKQDPSNSQHNEFELQLLDARHRSALDFVTLLDDTIPCVESEGASSAHRVGAAILAMKLAVDLGRVECFDSVYRQASPLLYDSGVSERSRLEMQIIYRTMRGDGLVPVEDLRRFADVARVSEGELGYSRALGIAATACRLSARLDSGVDFLLTASNHALSHRLHSRLAHIRLASLQLHVAAGAFEQARALLREFEQCPIVTDNVTERNEIHCHEARLALEQGDVMRAVGAFELIETASPTYSVSRKGYYLALEVRIRLLQGQMRSGIGPLVSRLESAHLQMRTLGSQDFETYALYLGLCALGEQERGIELLREYVTIHRRVKWPLAQGVLDALDARCRRKTELVSVLANPTCDTPLT